jgi:2-(1,2-epoxy-1,2-dihydrophenyl)acetyl-CoA isomerase
MTYETIRVGVEERVATITLNRPEIMNGLNAPMRRELLHAFRHAPETARAIILTGAGRAFCSGQDLEDAANPDELDLERTLREEYEPLILAIHRCPVPTIAAVNGPAAGAGASLAFACDICIATESAFFAQAFARIGLIPDGGSTYWLPRQVGFAKAMGAALLADKIPARQAADWNMIWEAVPDDAFATTVRARALHLAQGPTEAYRRIKQALRSTYGRDLAAQLDLEARLQGEAGHTRDFAEGIAAFLDKRPPRFEGS